MWAYLIVILPLVLGFITSRSCPQNRNKISKAQPDGWVFGVVWTILYLLIGYCWMVCRGVYNYNYAVDIIFGLNMVFINLWIVLYNCKQNSKDALYTFIPSIATALMCLVICIDKCGWYPSVLLCPYIAWLLYACQLNFDIVVR